MTDPVQAYRRAIDVAGSGWEWYRCWPIALRVRMALASGFEGPPMAEWPDGN